MPGLHEIYRPSTFDEMYGNKGLLASLQSILKDNNRPHTYLFSGSAGCGKTTLARIMANELKCSEMDLIEINIGNIRGIDAARDIVDKLKFYPISGSVKVFILDEIHKATKDFQSLMLKPLEEPPDHVYFFLCTTEPDKLLDTILTRCTQFNVRKLGHKTTIELLQYVLDEEEKEIDDKYLEIIARESKGIPRTALILLRKIIDMNTKDINEESIIIEGEKAEHKELLPLLKALDNQNTKWDWFMKFFKSFDLEKDKLESYRWGILGYFSYKLLKGRDNRASAIISEFSDPFFNSGVAGFVSACFEINLLKI